MIEWLKAVIYARRSIYSLVPLVTVREEPAVMVSSLRDAAAAFCPLFRFSLVPEGLQHPVAITVG